MRHSLTSFTCLICLLLIHTRVTSAQESDSLKGGDRRAFQGDTTTSQQLPAAAGWSMVHNPDSNKDVYLATLRWTRQNQFLANIASTQNDKITNTNRYYIVDRARYTWYLRPNTILEQDGIVYETNSFGLRDVEFPLTKPEATLRIVCLGDSVTYGAGVSFEETYEQQLEKKLRARGVDARVINAGIGSHRAWHGLERLEQDVIRFRPDMVVICFGLNDGALSGQTLREEWKARLAHQKSSGLMKQQSVDSISSRQPTRAGLVPNVPIGEFKKHLRALVTQLRRRTQANVYLVTFNSISGDYQRSEWSPELRKQQRLVYAEYRNQVLEIAREMRLGSADVYQRFEMSGKSLLNRDGIHPNAQGMAVYADELFKQMLSDLGL